MQHTKDHSVLPPRRGKVHEKENVMAKEANPTNDSDQDLIRVDDGDMGIPTKSSDIGHRD
jgi:hypothetical protein